jgi:molybdenum cofactor biosynthesis protein B
MSTSVAEHRACGPELLRVAVLTVSDSRTLETDTSGALILRLCEEAGHRVAARVLVPDEPALIRPLLETWRDRDDVDAVLITGGTGISPRDLTIETVSGLITKMLPGYGEMFRWLSFQEIGPAAMLSRAVGGVMNHTSVFVMPGSTAAVELALSRLILPELGHMAGLVRKVK